MARQPQRRQLTGCIRRGPKRQKSSYRRAMHLSHREVGYRHKLQQCIAIDGSTARSALRMLPPLILLTLLIRNSVINPTTPNTLVTAISFLLRIQHTHYVVSQNRFLRGLHYDHLLHDIPLEEEEGAASTRIPRQHIRFDSWTDQECYDNTSFTKEQLRRIYRLFGLAQHAAQTNGYIRVFSGFEVYKFHPEEMFLFLMTKCRTGHTNRHLCDHYFGGHQSRWSFGYPWMLRYLDERYEDTIGNQGLRRFIDHFPAFYNAFNKFIRKTSTHHYNDNSAEDHTGLRFLPFDIFALIDCSIYRINRPFSGPDGDYIGAPRKAEYYYAQKSVYTGYKKCHGIKVQTVMLPNGISCLYGPSSARVSDVAGVLQMSGLDGFLLQIQQGRNHIYSVFGDGVYNANGLHCEYCILPYFTLLTYLVLTFARHPYIISLFYVRCSIVLQSIWPWSGFDTRARHLQH